MSSSEARAAKMPVGREPTLRVVPEPADVNFMGDIFGGWIMSKVDVAGGIPALRHCGGRVVTVAVNSFAFKQPVFVGDIVSLYAQIVRVGRTSVTVGVEVYAQRHFSEDDIVKVTEATLTYVAVDDNRRPRQVSSLPRA
jgi:acyl-CoA thioesterase YciA